MEKLNRSLNGAVILLLKANNHAECASAALSESPPAGFELDIFELREINEHDGRCLTEAHCSLVLMHSAADTDAG